MMKNENYKYYGTAFFCFSILIFIFSFRKIIFFRDYSIIFEGALRLSLGQIPFNDFGIPMGPISLIIPAIFFKLFGVNWSIFQLSQMLINALILVVYTNIIIRITNNKYIIFIFVIALSFYYLIFITHPWYNTTALLFYLLALFFSLQRSKLCWLISGLTASFCFFSKQDYGLICIFSIVLSNFIIYSNYMKFNKSLSFHNYRYFLKKEIISSSFMFLLGFFLLFICLILIWDLRSDVVLYWFNYGQEYQSKRTIPLDIIYSTRFWLSIFCLYLAFLNKSKYLLVTSIIIFSSVVVGYTSGLEFTSHFDIALYPGIIISLFPIHNFISIVNLIKTSAIILIVFSSIQNFVQVNNIYESIFLQKVEPPYFFNYRIVGDRISKYSGFLTAFNGSYLPQETISALEQLATDIHVQDHSEKNLKMLNISELTPLYAALSILPPKGMPLWYDSNVILFNREVKKIESYIKNSEFDIILIQFTHHDINRDYNLLIKAADENANYFQPSYSKFRSPAGAESSCINGDCENARISVYVKRDLIQ